MKPYIEERVIKVANYTVATKSTVRDTAKKFGISKSTVHKDLRDRLIELDLKLYNKVNEVLEFNYSERHIRGGIATKERFEEIQKIGKVVHW